MTLTINFTRRKPVPTAPLVGCRQICDGSVAMAQATDPRDTSANAPCLHPRLILETTTKDRRYLTGHYVCEECGQRFDRPPVKEDPP